MEQSDDSANGEQRTHQTVDCPHCGTEVPIADFCTRCGEPLRADAAPRDFDAPSPPPLPVPVIPAVADARGSAIARFLPGVGREQVDAYRLAIGFGLLLVIIALLIGSAGLAITISVFIVPIVTLMYFTDTDLYEREPLPILLGVVAAGFVAGIIIALINDFLVDELWIEDATLNVGAAGFGGRFAEQEGGPPILVLLLSGLFLPVIGLALAMAAPVYLRRWAPYRNEVLDGMTLGAAAGGGFAAAGAIVYYWPLFDNDTVHAGNLSDWTATLLALLLLRPLIFGLAGALAGAALWHYAFQLRTADLTLPLAAGLGGAVVYAIGDLLIQSSGTLAELIWIVVVLVGLLAITRVILGRALAYDRQALSGEVGRMTCPHCGRVTPVGAYCAVCGKPLPDQAPVAATHVEQEPAVDEGDPPPHSK